MQFCTQAAGTWGDVRLVNWTSSPHVGHYRQHPIDYRGAVSELLGKASTMYSQRMQRLEGEKMGSKGGSDEISEPLGDLRKATVGSNDIFKRFSAELAEHAFSSRSSLEYHGGRAVGSVHDEKPDVVRLRSPPAYIARQGSMQMGFLDKSFLICVPKIIEEWDVGPLKTLNRSLFPSRWPGLHFNPMKCIRHSRL